MSPSQVRGAATGVLADVRTQIIAAVIALQAFGYVVLSPGEQIKAQATQIHGEVEVLQRAVNAQNDRIDSIASVVRLVEALVKVQCVQAKQQIVKDILECRR